MFVFNVRDTRAAVLNLDYTGKPPGGNFKILMLRLPSVTMKSEPLQDGAQASVLFKTTTGKSSVQAGLRTSGMDMLLNPLWSLFKCRF